MNTRSTPADVHYRHSMAPTVVGPNQRHHQPTQSRQNGNLRYHNTTYVPNGTSPNHYNYNTSYNNNYYNNGAILPPKAHLYSVQDPTAQINHKAQSFSWAPSENGGTMPRQPITNGHTLNGNDTMSRRPITKGYTINGNGNETITRGPIRNGYSHSNSPYDVNSNYDSRSVYTAPGNYYGVNNASDYYGTNHYYGTNNYYGTINSRYSIPASYDPGVMQEQPGISSHEQVPSFLLSFFFIEN